MMSLRLLAVGDISLRARCQSNPFKNTKAMLANKDILFGNLETVLSYKGRAVEKALLLRASPDKARFLKEAGFDVLSVANNHVMDFGQMAFNDTLKALKDNGLLFVGNKTRLSNFKPVIIKKKGLKVGFLGYCGLSEDKIIDDIRRLRQMCDFCVVSLHWGTENVFYPSPKQILLAHKLVDAGADLILGHHPHVVQGIEKYKDKLIVYSLANFQFEFSIGDGFFSRAKRTNESIMLSVNINKKRVCSYRIIPLKIDKNFVPSVPTRKEGEAITCFIEEISAPLRKKIEEWWWFEQAAKIYVSQSLNAWVIRIKKYGLKHFLLFIKWIFSLFCIKCYLALLKKGLKSLF